MAALVFWEDHRPDLLLSLCLSPVRSFLPLTCSSLQALWGLFPALCAQLYCTKASQECAPGSRASPPHQDQERPALIQMLAPWTEKGPPVPGLLLSEAFLLRAEMGCASPVLRGALFPCLQRGPPSSPRLTWGLSCAMLRAEAVGGCCHDIHSAGPVPGAGPSLGSSLGKSRAL